MTQKFAAEFPDYPVAAFPVMPDGFEDSSWRNDACPSITNEAARLHVFVDYPDENDREAPGMKRFAVNELDVDGCLINADPILSTDDWADVLLLIESRKV